MSCYYVILLKLDKEDATDEEIKAAAIDANAHEFIMSLPQVCFELALSF
jgi:ABC-type multidrug transport system fused ATPase/permease subunit